MPRLVLVVGEIISEWVDKGEVLDRYYNPGEVFDAVDLIMLTTDRPDPSAVQRLVGAAEVTVHSCPLPSSTILRLNAPGPIQPDLTQVRGLARRLRPDVIRCYGAGLNAAVGAILAEDLDCPFLISLHALPEPRLRPSRADAMEWAIEVLRRRALRSATLALPVYEAIARYLDAVGGITYRVAHNMTNPSLRPRPTYTRSNPPRLLSVGRHIPEKNPDSIIRALQHLPDAELTLVGHGSLQDHLVHVAGDAGVTDRTTFISAMSNNDVCASFASYDVFTIHSTMLGIPKTVLEATLAGMPVVVNREGPGETQEFNWARVVFTHNTPEGYAGAIHDLLEDDELREAVGRRAAAAAWDIWAPAFTEERFASFYRGALARGRR